MVDLEPPIDERGPTGIDALRSMNAQLHEEVLLLVTRKRMEAARTELPRLEDYPLHDRQRRLAAAISQLIPEIEPADIVFRTPPPHIDANLTISIPKLQKTVKGEAKGERIERFRKEIIPRLIAELPGKLPWPIKLTQVGIFLNVSFDRADFTNETIGTVELLGDKYGNSDAMKDERILIDFSSPNTAKTMHVGHLRSTIIGQVLINLLRANGAITYDINHLGDWGTQFGQLVTAYRLWAHEVRQQIDPNENPTGYLSELYRRIKSAITDEETRGENALAEDGRRNFAALEKGDPEIVALWRKFREMSLLDFQRVYDRLGIKFDMVLGESFYEDKMDEPVQEAIDKGIAKMSKGALVVDFKDTDPNSNIPLFILRKADGGSTYVTRDVSAIRYRRRNFQVTRIFYVIGSEQRDHLRSFFELARQLGDIEGGECEHIDFGLMKQGGQKIASRKGAGGLEDLLDQLEEKAAQLLSERYKDDPAIPRIAEQLGSGALIYANFRQNKERDMEFNPAAMLDLNAQSGIYIQYTAVRLRSLAEILGMDGQSNVEPLSSETIDQLPTEAHQIIKLVADFPSVVKEACEQRAAHLLANYLYGLSGAVNGLYTATNKPGMRMKDACVELKIAYSRIVQSVSTVIERGLVLLNMQVPEKM